MLDIICAYRNKVLNKKLVKLKVFVMPLEEQNVITKNLITVNFRLEQHQSKLEALIHQKRLNAKIINR
jgi:hypothetical protein